jgi:very-short-patch-repair endonuclease
MTITINRKRKTSIEVFPTIDDFIIYLKNNYNNINFESSIINSSIESIYKFLLEDESNVQFIRLTRWLPSKFGFKHSNKFSLPFWIERGFTELDYVKYSESIFKERGDRLSKHAKNIKNESYIFDYDYTNLYLFNTIEFVSNDIPKCKICDSNLILKKSVIQDKKIYLIEGCENINCITKNVNDKESRWKAFLPEDKYREVKNNLKSVKRSFSKDFWIKKGLTEEESIKKVFEIQSNNSKKFKGKRTGKSKDKLKEKGYTDEEIRISCLSQWNLEYWIRRGYNEEDSKEKVYKIQSYAAKHVDCEKRLLPSNVEYWVNRGHSYEESEKLVSKSQTTFSKDICIEKWGYEKGINIFNDRTKKWLNSLKLNNNIFIGYSKISQELFNEIYNRLNRNFKYATNGGEFKIQRENGGFYFYDFTDIDNKLIIEYNGDMYHANPDKYGENDNPHPFRKEITSKEIWEKDRLKFESVEKIGYKVLTIWDSEYRHKGFKNKELIIERCINFLLNK